MSGGMSIGPGLGLERSMGGGASGPQPLKILMVGSSTVHYYFAGFTGPDNPEVTASTDGVTFSPLGTAGAGACTLGDYLNTALDRPIKLINQGTPGLRVSQLAATVSASRAAAVAAAVAAGGVDLIIVGQMFNDVNEDSSVTSVAVGLAREQDVAARFRGDLGAPNLPIFFMSSQKYNGADATKLSQIVWARMAEEQISEEPNNYLYAMAYDLPQDGGGVHLLDGPAYEIHALRGAREIRALLESAPTRTVRIATGYTPLNIEFTAFPTAGWNTLAGAGTPGGAPAGTVSNLVDTLAVSTPWSITVTDNGEGCNALGAVTANAPWTASIMKFNLVDSTLNHELSFEIGGLDDTRFYDIREAASRTGTPSRFLNCSINGGTVLTADVINNTGTLARFPGIQPSGGKITGKMAQGTGNTIAAYLAGLIITERAY